MSRSLKKGPYVNKRILKKLQDLKPGDKTVIKVWDRGCTIRQWRYFTGRHLFLCHRINLRRSHNRMDLY